MTSTRTPIPVVVVDRVGYGFYRRLDGTPFLSPEEFEVRLVTKMDKLAEATGDELSAVVALPGSEHAAFRESARMLHGLGGRPAARIAAITERYLLPVAELRAELGLPGMTVEQTLPFRDKVRMKEHLRDRGVRVPDFAPYHREAALRLLDKYGTVVIKPRLGAGSADVSVIRDADGIDEFESAYPGRFTEFEVEEFIDGVLHHIDCVVDRGRVVVATAGRSIDPTTNFKIANFQATSTFRDVGVSDGPELDRLLEFNAEVAAAHPDFLGVLHHEVFDTADGVCFCELAARAGGGGIVAGFTARTGHYLDEVVLKSHLLDTVPSQIPVNDVLTGYTLLYARPGRLISMPPAPAMPWILETQLMAGPGDLLDEPADWGDAVAIVTVTGRTEAEVTNRLDTVIATMVPGIVVERA